MIEPVMRNNTVEPVPPTVAVPSTADADAPQDMVLIPAGEFQMGSNAPEAFVDEQPIHPVYLNAFYMDRYEVTNAQYQQFVLEVRQWQKDRIAARFHDGNYLKHWNGNNYPPGKAEHPVVYVSWYAAMAYAEWAGKRLPTEAEWEKAARGGLVGQKYPHGDSIDTSKANYGLNRNTVPIGQYPANRYGLYDMAGNVWEWCLDAYDLDFYSESRYRNPIAGPDSITRLINRFGNVESVRVLRGGSWGYLAHDVRVSVRGSDAPTFTNDDVGFRCVKDVRP